jgi:class 3 adenylate cyclase/tetratricopeptide (TPR) repeat protein
VAATENVTVLFTDLVGSTELSSSLLPDAADDVRRAHFAALREVIAATGGTEVKSLGDGLMVGFDATISALSCAVAMNQAVESHNRKTPLPLAIRIGISAGDVTVEDSDYFGDPVIEAARLCAVAQGGQILATDVVKLLARRSGHNFATERELELKGLPEPVVAWEVLWESIDEGGTSGIPVPPRLPQVPPIGVVGRSQEQERLKETLKAVTSGQPPRIVLVSGEAGVGKSTLTSSFARDAHVEGAVVLYGRCDEDLAVPYRPFVEALTQYLAHADDAVISELGDDHLAALVHLVPALQKRRPDLEATRSSDPDAERWMLYGAVVALIERASLEAPVVLLLDDLHWADRPTLQLLRHSSNSVVGRVVVLGTYREAELSSSHPLTETLAALTREPWVTRMPLSGLDDDEVVSFVEAASGQSLDGAAVELAHALYRETDGNPFFVGEVLRHLVETRAIVQDDSGRWVPTQELSAAGLPESVRQVIGSRVARLGDEATRILSAASVLGQEFDVGLLCTVVGTGEDAVLDVLEVAGPAALTAEVRTVAGRFRFAHALIQHTLYDDLGTTRRARLHRDAAEALEASLGPDPGARAGELARHWLAATAPSESSKAATYARLAGDVALGSLAAAEAIRWYEDALGVLAHAPEDAERAKCLAGLGEAQRQTGNAAYRETLLDAARLAQAIGDVDSLVQAALANNRGFQSAAGFVDQERLTVLTAALEAIGTADSRERCRLLALVAEERTYDGDFVGRQSLCDEALQMAHRVNDPATVLDVLIRAAQATWMPDTVDELRRASIEGAALADRLGDPVGQFWVSVLRSTYAIQIGDIEDVTRCHAELSRLASEVGQPILQWTSAWNLCWSTLLSGDIARAEALADTAFAIGNDTGQPDALAIYGIQISHVRWYQGRYGEMADLMVGIAAENPDIPSLRTAAARSLIDAGRDDEAHSMLAEEMSSGFSVPDDFLLPVYLDGCARVASHLNDQDAATALYPRLALWPNLVVFGGPAVMGSISLDLGTLATVLGQYQAAEAHFAEALRVHEKMTAPFLIAGTRIEWGHMLLSRRESGDLGRARVTLRSALELAHEYGLAGLERRALEELSMSD